MLMHCSDVCAVRGRISARALELNTVRDHDLHFQARLGELRNIGYMQDKQLRERRGESEDDCYGCCARGTERASLPKGVVVKGPASLTGPPAPSLTMLAAVIARVLLASMKSSEAPL